MLSWLVGEVMWYVPVLIFCARIIDVSIGTVRMILVYGGYSIISAILGFVEVMVWVLAVGWALKNIDTPIAILAYAGGYSTGIMIGIALEHRIGIGWRVVRVINPNGGDLAIKMRQHGYRVTKLDGQGRDGPVEVAFLVIRRRQLDQLREHLASIAPKAFISVERAERPNFATWPPSGPPGVRARIRGMFVRK